MGPRQLKAIFAVLAVLDGPQEPPPLRGDVLRQRLRVGLSNHHFEIEGSNGSLGATNEKRPHMGTFLRLAEREGFEPS